MTLIKNQKVPVPRQRRQIYSFLNIGMRRIRLTNMKNKRFSVIKIFLKYDLPIPSRQGIQNFELSIEGLVEIIKKMNFLRNSRGQS